MKTPVVRPRGAGWLVMAAAIALTPVATGPANAGVIHAVTDLGDTAAPGQLRALIDAAAPGDTIVIPSGTIALRNGAFDDANARGDLDIAKSLNIVGAGVGSTVLDGSGSDRVLEVHADAVVSISGVTIQNGADPGDYGGGIANRGSLRLDHVSIQHNARGGGLATFGVAMLTDVTIDDNAAAGSGGGIYNDGDLTLERVTISANSAGSAGFQSGGGIFSTGRLTLTNVTISGNSAVLFGGGIAQFINANATLTNVTIADNIRPASSAGIANGGATMRLRNVVIASGPGASNCGGQLLSLGHNLSSDRSCSLGGAGDRNGVGPVLGPLQNNGGPTATHVPLPRSGAIDTGDNTNCPDTDQRGAPRPADGTGDDTRACDIGAYELQPTCVGDCGTDGAVTIDELVLMVKIALGNANAALCRTGDVNGNEQIAVNEVVEAVNAALRGCSTPPAS